MTAVQDRVSYAAAVLASVGRGYSMALEPRY
jgi:hypothetical protein